MAEDTATPEAPTPEAPADQPKPEAPATDALGDAGKKALDAERRDKRAAEKRAAELEARLKEFEDRDKSESQRLAERADAAEKQLQEITLRALRLEVAAEKGLSPAQAKRLVGTTREELESDADELMETFKAPEPTPPSLDLGPRTAAGQADESPRGLITAGLQHTTKK